MMNQTNSGFLNEYPAGNEKSYHYKLAILGSQPCTAESRRRFSGFIRASRPGATDFKAYQIVSYMFMHDTHSFAHVFLICSPFICSPGIGERMGPQTFLDFFTS